MWELRHGPHSMPLAISRIATLPRDARIPLLCVCKCLHRAMIHPFLSSLGSYHKAESASGASQSWDEPPFPCAGQTVADLSGSESLRPMARRGSLLICEWLCVFLVRRWRTMGRLLILRAAERNVPRYLDLDVSSVLKGQSVSCRWNSSCLGRLPRSGRDCSNPNATNVQDEDFNVTTGWFVPLHFMVARLGNIEI
jgi:hypothetical protein